MFINCPYCRALVATDPATDLPPAHCPECGGPLREGLRTHASERGQTDAQDRDGGPMRDGIGDEASRRATHSGDRHDGDSIGEDTDGFADASRVARDAVAIVDAHGVSEGDAFEGEASKGADSEATVDEGATQEHPPPQRTSSEYPPTTTARPRASTRASVRAPSFARERSVRASARAWPGIAAIGTLTLLLVLQLLLADRARLAADARWRPLVQTLCAGLGCDLPPWREPGAFTLLQRDVRQHPGEPGALRVSATFRNDARWPQPWPRLHLTLSDGNGRVAGERSFEAHEYLGGTPEQSELGSGESATVAMDILEPAPQIVAYDFKFR